MAMAASEIDINGDVVMFELEFSDISMDVSQEDHSQILYACDVDIPALIMETNTQPSSTASLTDGQGESGNDLEEPIEIDENSIPSVIEEICPVDGPCVQCEIEQPCSFRFTNNGETLYVCNEPCIKAYQAEYPGKYTVTRKKYIIEEITPKTSPCSECEQNKKCYFYHNFDGEETYYCSVNCLEGMMADEKDKYAFKLKSGTICIDQIRPKEGQCLICEKVKPCEFSLVRYGEPCLLCERACIKVLSGRERGRYYIKKLKVSKPAADKNLDEGHKIQAKTAAMIQREQNFHRRCSQCTLILMIDGNVLTWEAMDFCDEICLERFQKEIGSTCAKCNTLVQHTSLGKYCVRFGYDIRQFCNSGCLDEFKKGLKICYYCQRDISDTAQVFLAPVGDKEQLKHFCAQSCVEKFDQMSKNPVPQPVRAKCAVCSLEKATTIEVEVMETASQRLCSNPCFAAFKFANNIVPDQCIWCKKYFELNPTKSFTIYNDSNPNSFCSLSCKTIYIHYTRFIVSCNWCESKKYNFDMIRRVENGQAVIMCSLNCLSLSRVVVVYQESENALSSSNGVPPPTLVPSVPSVEQDSADVMASAAEQLITLTKSRKRGETAQSSKQEQHQRSESAKKVRFANPKSPRSGRKKETRTTRISEEMSDDLPVGIASETPERPKRKRRLPSKLLSDSLIENPWYQPKAGPSGTAAGQGGQGSSASLATEEESSTRASPVGAHSSTILRDNLALCRKRRIEDKRRVGRMSPEARRELEKSRAMKERGLFLMPDARPKRNRKPSPERMECPLKEGTPRKLPPRILQRRRELVNSTERSAPPPPSPTPTQPPPSPTPLRRVIPTFSPSIGIRSVTPEEAESLLPTDIEILGFTLDSSAVSSPKSHSPRVSTPKRPGSPCLFEVDDNGDSWVPRPTEGSDLDEDDIIVNPQDRAMIGAGVHQELVLELDAAEDAAIRELSRAQDAEATNFKWFQDVTTFTGSKEEFLGPSGPTFPVNGETPLTILQKIWDVELMRLIVEQTNKYARREIIKTASNKSRMTRWHDTSLDEMWVFFAVLMLQSLAPLPVESEYWYPKLDALKMPNLAKIMPFNRFILIKKCLHFVDNAQNVGTSNEDKRLAKIKPLIDALRGKFTAMYMPAQEIALDESLLMWKGRLSFAQLIANKKARVGVKSYELCESKTGYLWDFRVYTGKNDSEPSEGDANEPHSAKIVFDLVRPLLGRGHVLVMDNFYNAPLLSRLLKKQKTDTMGTLRLNREFVPNSLKLSKSQLRQGEVAFSQTTDMTIVVWRDANIVALISTYHKVQVGGKEKYGRYFYKPQVVLDYNQFMGGVDKKDQLLSAFPMERCRNSVWYKKLFRRLLNVSIMNAWIIFCHHNTTMPARRYRQNLVEEILAKHKIGWAPSGSVTIVTKTPIERLVEGGHYPMKSESRSHRCKWCSMHGRASRTKFRCDVCDVPLCIYPCFKDFHTKSE